jgi:RNA polymerase sigma-70 factor (ECF subfamily)
MMAFRTLGEKDQEVLRLHAWEGLAGKALAVALGCTTGTAAVRLHRARRRLERLLTSPPLASARSTTRQEGLRR